MMVESGLVEGSVSFPRCRRSPRYCWEGEIPRRGKDQMG